MWNPLSHPLFPLKIGHTMHLLDSLTLCLSFCLFPLVMITIVYCSLIYGFWLLSVWYLQPTRTRTDVPDSIVVVLHQCMTQIWAQSTYPLLRDSLWHNLFCKPITSNYPINNITVFVPWRKSAFIMSYIYYKSVLIRSG